MKRAALIVGVDHYEDGSIRDLDWAEADARDIWAFLKHKAGYDPVELLLGARTSFDRIRSVVTDMLSQLSPGDLFLFYFAGHGTAHNDRPLLLLPGAALRYLKYFQHTLPVDLLKEETDGQGLSRVFVLDSCRGNLMQTRDSSAEGQRGVAQMRNLGQSADARSPLAILHGCEENRQAQEIAARRHGLFSLALLEELERAVSQGQELRVDDHLVADVKERMTKLAREHGLPLEQEPWKAGGADRPVLLPGMQRVEDAVRDALRGKPAASRGGITIERGAVLKAEGDVTGGHKVVVTQQAAAALPETECPICGAFKSRDQTFKCKRCHRVFCQSHQVKVGNAWCCEECAVFSQ